MEKKAVLLIIVAVVVILVAGFFAYRMLAASKVDVSHKLLFPFPKDTQLLRAPGYDLVNGEGVEFHVASGVKLLAPFSGRLDYFKTSNPVAPMYGGEVFIINQYGSNLTVEVYTSNGAFDSSLVGRNVVKGQVIGSVGGVLPDRATRTNASVILIYRTIRSVYINLSNVTNWEQGSVKW